MKLKVLRRKPAALIISESISALRQCAIILCIFLSSLLNAQPLKLSDEQVNELNARFQKGNHKTDRHLGLRQIELTRESRIKEALCRNRSELACPDSERSFIDNFFRRSKLSLGSNNSSIRSSY